MYTTHTKNNLIDWFPLFTWWMSHNSFDIYWLAWNECTTILWNFLISVIFSIQFRWFSNVCGIVMFFSLIIKFIHFMIDTKMHTKYESPKATEKYSKQKEIVNEWKNAINFPIKITTFIGKHIKTKKIDKNSMRCNFANERLHLDWQNLDEKPMTSRSTQQI